MGVSGRNGCCESACGSGSRVVVVSGHSYTVSSKAHAFPSSSSITVPTPHWQRHPFCPLLPFLTPSFLCSLPSSPLPSRSVQPKARLHLLREHARLRVVPDDAKHEADEGVQGQVPKGPVGVRRGVHHAGGRKRRLSAGQVRVDRGVWGELPAAKMMEPFQGRADGAFRRRAGNGGKHIHTQSCGALPY